MEELVGDDAHRDTHGAAPLEESWERARLVRSDVRWQRRPYLLVQRLCQRVLAIKHVVAAQADDTAVPALERLEDPLPESFRQAILAAAEDELQCDWVGRGVVRGFGNHPKATGTDELNLVGTRHPGERVRQRGRRRRFCGLY